jgi:hypothetical protein
MPTFKPDPDHAESQDMGPKPDAETPQGTDNADQGDSPRVDPTVPGDDGAREDETPDWSGLSSFVVAVDFSETDGQIKDLFGVCRSPITASIRCREDRNPFVDVSPIYRKIGVTSVRVNNDGLEVSQLFSRMPSASTWGFHFGEDDELDFPFAAPGIPWLGKARVRPSFCNSRFHEDVYSSTSEWVYWFPHAGRIQNSMGYVVGNNPTDLGVQAQEVFDGCAEFGPMYIKLGEQHFGARYVGHAPLEDEGLPVSREVVERYAEVARRAFQLLISSSSNGAVPAYFELWGEPDQKYKGPYFATKNNHAQYEMWGQDFAEMHRALYEAVSDMGQAGGCGFTRAGWMKFVETVEQTLAEPDPDLRPEPGQSGRVFELLDHSSKEYWDFFSVHRYMQGTEFVTTGKTGEVTLRTLDQITDAMLEFPDGLRRLRNCLDAYTARLTPRGSPSSEWGWDRLLRLPLHVTEWNICTTDTNAEFQDAYEDLEGGELEVFGSRNLSASSWGAAFASAALTWMQVPSLGIDRANYWPGLLEANGMIRRPTRDEWVAPGGDKENWVTINAPAYSFSLHTDLAGRDRVPVNIWPSATGEETGRDELEAAAASCRVTALAACSQLGGQAEQLSIIISNIDNPLLDKLYTINLRLRGLIPGETYQLRARRVENGFGVDPAFTNSDQDGRWEVNFDNAARTGPPDQWTSADRVQLLDVAAMESAWDNLEDTTYFSDSVVAEEETWIAFPFYHCGVVRLDLTRSLFEEEPALI